MPFGDRSPAFGVLGIGGDGAEEDGKRRRRSKASAGKAGVGGVGTRALAVEGSRGWLFERSRVGLATVPFARFTAQWWTGGWQVASA